jgi:hypothetical protein
VTLIRGADVKVELFLSGAWSDITCEVTSVTWTWGTSEALGPLTESEGGTMRASLYDPTRKYDPENAASPLFAALKVGIGLRATVDAAPAWTGVLQSWGWDRASHIADFNGLDPMGQLSVRILPTGADMGIAADTSTKQVTYLLDQVGWPVGKRYFPTGSVGVTRSNHYVEGSVLDGLHQVRFAELGQLYARRDGVIVWVTRGGVAPPPVTATINCGGVGVTDAWVATGLGRVRNRVAINGHASSPFGPVLPIDEQRSVSVLLGFLNFPGATPDPYVTWADAVLAALTTPKPMTLLGTIVPVGAEVKTIVCAEYGARWKVSSPDGDRTVQVLGETVSVSPGWLEVDAVTEDV